MTNDDFIRTTRSARSHTLAARAEVMFSLGKLMLPCAWLCVNMIPPRAESLHALSGVLALALASTPRGEISACKIDALTDLSYKIHLNLDQLEEIWAQVSDEQTKGRN